MRHLLWETTSGQVLLASASRKREKKKTTKPTTSSAFGKGEDSGICDCAELSRLLRPSAGVRMRLGASIPALPSGPRSLRLVARWPPAPGPGGIWDGEGSNTALPGLRLWMLSIPLGRGTMPTGLSWLALAVKLLELNTGSSFTLQRHPANPQVVLVPQPVPCVRGRQPPDTKHGGRRAFP